MAISTALERAEVSAKDVTYIECHATATLMGDGIEVRGLKMAFEDNLNTGGAKQPAKETDVGGLGAEAAEDVSAGRDRQDAPWCALGSIKGNIGHANCAAGVTGLIKTVLCMHNKTLVPTAHYETANPKLKLADDGNPFFIHEGNTPWELPNGTDKRIAGVSSFGIGGTNCHVVLQEHMPKPVAPAELPVPEYLENRHPTAHAWKTPWSLLPVSAKTNASLRRSLEALSNFLKAQKAEGVQSDETDASIVRVAHTLQHGREEFAHRLAVAAKTVPEAIAELDRAAAGLAEAPGDAAQKEPGVIFMFPGQGSQHLNMGRGLYETLPAFKRELDACAELLLPQLGGRDIRNVLYPPADVDVDKATAAFNAPEVLQPALFSIEYCLAQVLMGMGVRPVAVAGHSIGEYVAATIAGVLKLEDALSLVVLRSSATKNKCATGAMLSVRMPEVDAATFVDDFNVANPPQEVPLSLAAANSPVHQVLSGTAEVLALAEAQLTKKGIRASFLHVTHGFHSDLMRPAATVLEAFIDGLEDAHRPGSPKIPMTSNVTGKWLQNEAAEGCYWAQHLTGTVKWVNNVRSLLKWKPDVMIEVGPGSTLCTLSSKTFNHAGVLGDGAKAPLCVQGMRHPTADNVDDQWTLTNLMGSLWKAGVHIDWGAVHGAFPRNAVPVHPRVPTYSWDNVSHWENPQRSIYVDALATESSASRQTLVPLAATAKPSSVPPSLLLVRYATAAAAAAVQLYCFPYAGGSSRVFEEWATSRAKYPWMEIVAVEPQRRGARADEQRRGSTDEGDAEEVAAIAAAIDADASASTKIAFCGLSMGVLRGLEVYQALSATTREKVCFFGAAGRAPPAAPFPASAEEFDLDGLNLAPEAVTRSEMWADYFKPMLIDDLLEDSRAAKRVFKTMFAGTDTAVTTTAATSVTPVTCPVHVFCGTQDTSFPVTDAHAWRAIQSSGGNAGDTFATTHMAGGHSFLMEKSQDILAQVQNQLVVQGDLPRPPMATVNSVLHEVKWVATQPASASETACAAPAGFTAVKLACSAFYAGVTATMIDASGSLEQVHVDALQKDTSGLVVLGGRGGDLAESEAECLALMGLLQQLVADGVAGKLTLVATAHVHSGMLVGLLKAFTLEYPDVVCQRILCDDGAADAGQHPLTDTQLQALLSTGLNHSTQADVWVRTIGTRRRARSVVLTPQIIPVEVSIEATAVNPALQTEDDSVYVVTGGTGGIGQALIGWLIDIQKIPAANIAALCRNTGSPGAKALQERGVATIGVDISDAAAVASCGPLTELQNVRAVFHLAGVLDDGLISNMTRGRVRSVVAGKVDGLFNLLGQASPGVLDWDLEFVVIFSSTSSLFGYPGQTNYCAANAALDQFADTNTEEFNVISINWGPWGEAGMAGTGTKAHAQALRDGDQPLASKDALAALNTILARACQTPSASRRYAVCDVEWAASPWRDLPVVTALRERLQRADALTTAPSAGSQAAAEAKAPATWPGATDAGAAAAAGGGGSQTEQLLRSMIPRWAPSESLSAAGMDSLDIVQLRNTVNRTFGKQVPLSLFTKPNQTIKQLQSELQALLGEAP